MRLFHNKILRTSMKKERCALVDKKPDEQKTCEYYETFSITIKVMMKHMTLLHQNHNH